MNPTIHETEWKQSVNQTAYYKHFWASKNGRIFVAVATATKDLRFILLPMMRGTTLEMEFTPASIDTDENEARQKVVEWLKAQS